MTFRSIVIIYNPNSTGDSPSIAKAFHGEVVSLFPNIDVSLVQTEYRGHGETITYQAACQNPDVLIVSVSGDGGYHEVINGAMKAVDTKKATPICAILPGGNANDHYTSVSKRPLIEALQEDKPTMFDLLSVTYGDQLRYAHSYAGLGLTPLVAKELNDHSLTKLKEMWLALKTYWSLRPFAVMHDGTKEYFDSILMVIIDRMAKHLTLAKDNQPDDGNFELFQWPHGNKVTLTKILFRSLIGKHLPHHKATSYTFTTVKPLPMQLDGELVDLPAGIEVQVSLAVKKLRTFV